MVMAKGNSLRDCMVISQLLGKQETSLHLFGKKALRAKKLKSCEVTLENCLFKEGSIANE